MSKVKLFNEKVNPFNKKVKSEIENTIKSKMENKEENKENEEELLTVSVAESVTAGALSNILCEMPGASEYFYGGMVCYTIKSKKELLGIDIEYAEEHNFANPSTTLEMAKSIANKFNSRIGLSTTGYSLPVYREENKERKLCKLDIKIPYALICLYDRKTDFHKIIPYQNNGYKSKNDQRIEKAQMQSLTAIRGKKLYEGYCKSIKNESLKK